MNLTKIVKRFSQISIATILMLSTSGCVDNTLAEFDKTINQFANESADWRQLVKDLEKSTKETISYELKEVPKTIINEAGVEARCNVTFFDNYTRYEVRKQILRKRNELAQKIGASQRTIPNPLPVICTDSSVYGIRVEGKQPQKPFIHFYGYYLNPSELKVGFIYNEKGARKANIEDPTKTMVFTENNFLTGGQFKVSLNLGGNNGIPGEYLQMIREIRILSGDQSGNQIIHSIGVDGRDAEPTKAKVTVNFRSVDIKDDADPAGSAEVNFTFQVNGQTQNWRNDNANSGGSYEVNKQFQVTLSKEENLSIYVNGVDKDGGWMDEDDPLGQVTETFSASRNWGLGSHNMRSDCTDGCYYVNFDVDVDWID
jgi:hypothetical protein